MSRDGPVSTLQVGGGHVAGEEKEKRKSRRTSLFGRAPNSEREKRKEKRTSAPELMEKKPRAAYVPQHAAKDAMHLGLQPEYEPLPVPPDFAPEPHSVPWTPMPILPLAIDQRSQRSRSSSPAPFGPHHHHRSLGSTATLSSDIHPPANPHGQGESSRSYGSLASSAEISLDTNSERPAFTGVRPLSPRTLTSPNWTTQPNLSPLSIPSKPKEERPLFVGVLPQRSTNGLATSPTTPPADRPIFIGVTPRPFPNSHASLPPSFFSNGNGMNSSNSHILQPPRPPFSTTPPLRSLSSPVLQNSHQEPRSRRTSFNNSSLLHQASPLSLPPITASPSPPPSTLSPPPMANPVPDEPKTQPSPTQRQPLQHAATEPLPSKSPIINREEMVSPAPQDRKPNKLKKKRPIKLNTEFFKPTPLPEVVTPESFVEVPPIPRATEDDHASSASEAGTAFYTPVGSSTHSLKELPGDELPGTPKKSPKRFNPERVLGPKSPKIPHSPASSAQDYAEAYKLAIEEYSPHAVLTPVELDGDDGNMNEIKPKDPLPSEPPEKSKRRPVSLTYESLQNVPGIEQMDITELIPPPLDFSRGSASSSQSDLDRFPDIASPSKRHREHARRKSATPTKSLADSPSPSQLLDPSPEPMVSSEGSVTRSSDWPLQSTNGTSESSHTTERTETLEFHAIPYPPPGGYASETTLPSQSETEKFASAETVQQSGGQDPVPRPRKPNKLQKERRYSVSTQQSNTSSIWSIASSQLSRIVSYIKPRRRRRDRVDATNAENENGPDNVDRNSERRGRGKDGESEESGRDSRRGSFSGRGMFSFSRRNSIDKGERGERKRKEKREMPVAPALERYNRSVDRMKNMKTGIHAYGF